MLSLYQITLTFLASSLAAAANTCSALSSNFSMLANTSSTTNNYGTIDGSYGTACLDCPVQFSADASNFGTTYGISGQRLVVVSNPQNRTHEGYAATTDVFDQGTHLVTFESSAAIQQQRGYTVKLQCALQAESDASCTLVCQSHARGRGKIVTGDYLDPYVNNEWRLGSNSPYGPNTLLPTVIKAVPPPS